MSNHQKTEIPTNAAIYVTGHRGMVGSAVLRNLKQRGYSNILTATRQDLDLRDQRSVNKWFAEQRPEYVIHAAGLVGGIIVNSRRQADFLYDNLMIQACVLHAACKYRVTKLLNLGSSCVYPRDCPQPIREEYLLTGPLEATNFGYAVAKIAGIKACEAYRQQYGCHFISCMPSNLYGPGDNFDTETSHVLPGLIRKFDDARQQKQKMVTIWGSGKPRREFLHVDDLAEACLFLLENYDDAQTINVGSGEEITIAQLAESIRGVVYPEASIDFDKSKPDGTPRKILDSNRITQLGWRPMMSLIDGLKSTYQWYLAHSDSGLIEQIATVGRP